MNKVYPVIFRPQAVKDLQQLPAVHFLRIKRSIGELSKDPRPMGVKKLEGPIHRIRIGPWRVLYAIFDKEAQVTVLRIRRRNEKTYGNR